MRNKAFISVLIGAIIFGVLAATAVSNYLSKVRESTAPNAMVVAKSDIPLGAKVTAEHLTLVDVPKAATPDGTFTQLDQIIGRITTTKISAREPMTTNRLAAAGATGGLSSVIPEGSRAMTVNLDAESDLAGFLLPGTLVDVLAVINTDKGVISKIILQNIKVLANGQNLDQPQNERASNGKHTVMLQVMPEEAEKLALASAEGKLRLAMRNATDQGSESTQGTTKQTILAGARPLPTNEPSPTPRASVPPRKTVPAALRPLKDNFVWDATRGAPSPVSPPPVPPANPAPHPSVEVIEGGKRRLVVFPERLPRTP